MDKIIMHIDVNNAFLSWTATKMVKEGKKDLRKTYAIIGGDEKQRSGIVLAKSPLAKRKGVVTGETIYNAKKKCPHLEVYPPEFSYYKKMSNALFSLISKYTPDLEKMSIDECFIDYTPIMHIYGNPLKFAYNLKNEVKKTLGFTVNVGIANNKLCAKMASDFSKPDKVHTLFKTEIKTKMWPLPIDELFGVGKKTAIKLKNLNINTVEDLALTDKDKLKPIFKNMTDDLIDSAWGRGSDLVESSIEPPKGIGNETTLNHNIFSKEELHQYLLALSENVTIRLRKQNKYASVVVVTLKNKYFKRFSHQKKLVNATNITEEVYETAKEVLDEMKVDDGIRLIGVRLDGLKDEVNHQVSLFENLEEREETKNLDKAIDDLKEKYGFKIIKKASLINDNTRSKY